MSFGSGVVVYLVVVYQVENQVYVSVYGLVLSQLRFHPVQPVNESLEGVCKLAGEQQGLLKLVLPAGEHKSLRVNEGVFRSTAHSRATSRWGKIQQQMRKDVYAYLSIDLPQTVSHLSLSSLSMSSSF